VVKYSHCSRQLLQHLQLVGGVKVELVSCDLRCDLHRLVVKLVHLLEDFLYSFLDCTLRRSRLLRKEDVNDREGGDSGAYKRQSTGKLLKCLDTRIIEEIIKALKCFIDLVNSVNSLSPRFLIVPIRICIACNGKRELGKCSV